jgi:hypothetical protein
LSWTYPKYFTNVKNKNFCAVCEQICKIFVLMSESFTNIGENL